MFVGVPTVGLQFHWGINRVLFPTAPVTCTEKEMVYCWPAMTVSG